jgi:pilus assembly protein CpaC
MKTKISVKTKKIIASFFSVSLLLSVATLPESVEAKSKKYASNLSHSTYQIPYRSSRLFNLRKGETVIAASEPNIAFIEQLKDRNQLLIRGMGIGSTSIVLLNEKDHTSRTLNIEVTKNLDGLKKKLYQILPNENIKIQNAEGNIILSGEVSNLTNMDIAMKLAQAYAAGGQKGSQGSSSGSSSSSSGSRGGQSFMQNGVINMMQIGGGQQVTLEVKIAEVSRSLSRKFRISRSVNKTANIGSASDFIWGVLLPTAASVFTGSYITGDLLFNWTIDFTKDTGLAALLAEPNLTTLSGQKASFLSGGEFPYQVCNAQGQQGGIICNVGFKRFGVGLEFLPTVLGSNRINLNTHVSVSTLNNKAAEITGVETNVPSLAVREAQSTIELGDGQTMSIAGLLSNDSTGNQSQIPGLADVPLVGTLFRNRGATSDQKELIILVTPHLAKPVAKEQVRLPTDAFVEPDDLDFYLLGKMESRKVRPIQPADSSLGGITGQFGHQINEGGN